MGAFGAGAINAGSAFTIDSGPAAGAYVVTADTSLVANAATLPIFPALRGATAGAEVVTMPLHTASTSANLVFTPKAILAVSRRPAPLIGGVAESFIEDKQTGLGIRVAISSHVFGGAGTAYTTELSCDAVVAVGVADPAQIVQITGAV